MPLNTTRFAKNLEKAKLDTETAERIYGKLYQADAVFATIDRTFMKARMSGMTTNEIVAVIDTGVFKNKAMDEKTLIAVKPYLKFWPENPYMASLAYRAGVKPLEVEKIGAENITEDSLQVMIALN